MVIKNNSGGRSSRAQVGILVVVAAVNCNRSIAVAAGGKNIVCLHFF